jgi:hypothetical protein
MQSHFTSELTAVSQAYSNAYGLTKNQDFLKHISIVPTRCCEHHFAPPDCRLPAIREHGGTFNEKTSSTQHACSAGFRRTAGSRAGFEQERTAKGYATTGQG